jgi:hypothetical protein
MKERIIMASLLVGAAGGFAHGFASLHQRHHHRHHHDEGFETDECGRSEQGLHSHRDVDPGPAHRR